MAHLRTVFLLTMVMLSPSVARAGPILLQSATATFSGPSGAADGPAESIDGFFNDNGSPNGWSVFPDGIGAGASAAFETVTDVGPGDLTFRFTMNHGNPRHLLGRFRLSVTTDDRSVFADGLHTGR